MQTFIIANRKGGVGKTTTVLNLAGYFSKNKKVLMIDLDTQANLSLFFNIEDKGIHSALLDEDVKIHNVRENLYLINADINFNPSKIDERYLDIDKFLISKIEKKLLLRKLFNKKNFDKKFDVCIIDTSPSFDIFLINALKVGDFLISPMQIDFFSFIGIKQFIKILNKTIQKENKKLQFLGILPTMYNPSIKQHNEFLIKLKEYPSFFPIRRDYKLVEIMLQGEIPVFHRCRACKDYEKFAKYLYNKILHLKFFK